MTFSVTAIQNGGYCDYHGVRFLPDTACKKIATVEFVINTRVTTYCPKHARQTADNIIRRINEVVPSK